MTININIIADYGGESRNNNDLAFFEVKREFRDLFKENDLPRPEFEAISVGAFNTTEAAFVLAQLGLNQRRGEDDIYFVNVAPRKDDTKPRIKCAGEGLVVGVLPNGAAVFAVNSGNTLHFLSEAGVKFYAVKGENLNDSSQFRSRDTFPKPVVQLVRQRFEENISFADILNAEGEGKWELRGEKIDPKSIPSISALTLLYTDGYGNEKFELPSELEPNVGNGASYAALIAPDAVIAKGGKKAFLSDNVNPDVINLAEKIGAKAWRIKIPEQPNIPGSLLFEAKAADGIFGVKDGEGVLAPGSSGWNGKNFHEAVVRGGSAASVLGNPKPGDRLGTFSIANQGRATGLALQYFFSKLDQDERETRIDTVLARRAVSRTGGPTILQ